MSTQGEMNVYAGLQNLMQYVEAQDFCGYDPYDALNSPLIKRISTRSKILRIAFTQFLRRFPINLRPIIGTKKGLNPKGVGLFLWGYAKLYKLEKKQEYLDRIINLLDLLDKLKSRGYSGNCWGYNFDWQSRSFFTPKYTPTIVNSSFIGHALIDTYRYTGFEKALEMALPITEFILNDLNQVEEAGSICFSYTPFDQGVVHNANLLGASLMIRLYNYAKDEKLRDISLSSLEYSMKHQREDGSWLYGNAEFQNWIDSFHTGFNLQSILYFFEEGYGENYKNAFKRGVKFYSDNFFWDDGTPKYYHNKTYPIDIHSPAQAVVFFSKIGIEYKDLTEKVNNWMIRNLQDRRGYFYFRKNKHHVNRIPYMRWAQSWAFHALTEYYLSSQS